MPHKIDELSKTLGIDALSQEEQAKILSKVDKRLEEVMLQTVIRNLSPEEVVKFRQILEDGRNMEEEITKLTSGIPGLSDKIEKAVSEEILRLRAALAS